MNGNQEAIEDRPSRSVMKKIKSKSDVITFEGINSSPREVTRKSEQIIGKSVEGEHNVISDSNPSVDNP